MSSNKNLKVYKMLFITDLKQLNMAVKFACKIRVTWKRSNSSNIKVTKVLKVLGSNFKVVLLSSIKLLNYQSICTLIQSRKSLLKRK